MNNYIISIISISLISVVLFVIIPETKNGKLIKSIISILLVFAIIKPIFSFDFNSFNIENFGSVNIQENYINYIAQSKVEIYKEKGEKVLSNHDCNYINIEIDYLVDNTYNFLINKVYLIVDKNVIKMDKEHIDILENIKNELAKELEISVDKVEIKC